MAEVDHEKVVRERVEKAEAKAIELFKKFKMKDISAQIGFDLGFQLSFTLTWERESTLRLEKERKS